MPTLSVGQSVLPADESRHCATVMRCRVGDELLLLDGRGGRAFGQVVRLRDDGVEVEVSRLVREPQLVGRSTWLAVAPTKHRDRMEWMLEKAVEVGVSRVSFVVAANSERRSLSPDRMWRVARAAAKQCQTAYFPHLDFDVPLGDFLRAEHAGFSRFVAHLEPGVSQPLHLVLGTGTSGPSLVVVGPEGGLSPVELNLARAEGFVPVTLGAYRLRTETAAVAACVICSLRPEPTHPAQPLESKTSARGLWQDPGPSQNNK